MRISLSIDSATADETHDFVCAFQRTAGMAGPTTLNQDCTVTIAGSWSFGVATPAITMERADALLTEYNELREWRKDKPKLAELLGTPSGPTLFFEN